MRLVLTELWGGNLHLPQSVTVFVVWRKVKTPGATVKGKGASFFGQHFPLARADSQGRGPELPGKEDRLV
jgi:hypothetical protein